MAKEIYTIAKIRVTTSKNPGLPKVKDSYEKGRISKSPQNCTSGCYFSDIIKHLSLVAFRSK